MRTSVKRSTPLPNGRRFGGGPERPTSRLINPYAAWINPITAEGSECLSRLPARAGSLLGHRRGLGLKAGAGSRNFWQRPRQDARQSRRCPAFPHRSLIVKRSLANKAVPPNVITRSGEWASRMPLVALIWRNFLPMKYAVLLGWSRARPRFSEPQLKVRYFRSQPSQKSLAPKGYIWPGNSDSSKTSQPLGKKALKYSYCFVASS